MRAACGAIVAILLGVGLAVVATTGQAYKVAGPTTIPIPAPPAITRAGGRLAAEFHEGRIVAAQTGCLACHRIGSVGNRGPGDSLTYVGSRLTPHQIERALVDSRAPMPSFNRLPAKMRVALVTFLSWLRRK